MTLETKITTSFEKEIISDNLNEDFTETANLSIASNNFASEVVVFYVTDESDNNKTLYMRKPVNEELATEIVLVDNSEQTEQHIINTILLKEQRIINISRIEHLPTYLSLSKEFLHDEPPRYEIVTGKPLKTQLDLPSLTEISASQENQKKRKRKVITIILVFLLIILIFLLALGKCFNGSNDKKIYR
ncbi:uncharacterized protein LOC136085718 isoform X2 [Hydra vulgaris]|uniref:Uncharacterized protein LOC136085718 isoform X2 n=1 Tax=Hydra vulgaris TaxID=6087 RepID=A0ABM4CMT0_HYDVU